MSTLRLRASRLDLVLQSRDQLEAMIEAMTPVERAELSADWLARFRAAASADPWVHGFSAVHRGSGMVVGTGGFKGPPAQGIVEIAYGVAPDERGKGYATEIAATLCARAFASADVRIVRAHTLPESGASQRVLVKCGFERVGEVIDPEDGLVWRFEKQRTSE